MSFIASFFLPLPSGHAGTDFPLIAMSSGGMGRVSYDWYVNNVYVTGGQGVYWPLYTLGTFPVYVIAHDVSGNANQAPTQHLTVY